MASSIPVVVLVHRFYFAAWRAGQHAGRVGIRRGGTPPDIDVKLIAALLRILANLLAP